MKTTFCLLIHCVEMGRSLYWFLKFLKDRETNFMVHRIYIHLKTEILNVKFKYRTVYFQFREYSTETCRDLPQWQHFSLDVRKMWHHFTFWGHPDQVVSLSVKCMFEPVFQTMTTSEPSPVGEGHFNIKYRVTFKPFNVSAIFRIREQDQMQLRIKYS